MGNRGVGITVGECRQDQVVIIGPTDGWRKIWSVIRRPCRLLTPSASPPLQWKFQPPTLFQIAGLNWSSSRPASRSYTSETPCASNPPTRIKALLIIVIWLQPSEVAIGPCVCSSPLRVVQETAEASSGRVRSSTSPTWQAGSCAEARCRSFAAAFPAIGSGSILREDRRFQPSLPARDRAGKQ